MINKKRKSCIGEILASTSPQEAKKIENRMLVASKIGDAMRAKKWKNKDLMQALGKTNPSEITRWLSGTHNFTIDTLTDIGFVLDADFLTLEEKQETIIQKYTVSVYVKSVAESKSHTNLTTNSLPYFRKTAVLNN